MHDQAPAPMETTMEAQVLEIRRVPSPDPRRYGRDDAIIWYQIEGHEPRSIRLAAEDLDDAKVAQAIKADQGERETWLKKRLSI